MGTLHTFRGGYEAMRNGDVTVDDSILDGSTISRTWAFTDKPRDCIRMGSEYNGCEIYFGAGQSLLDKRKTDSAVAEDVFEVKFYGYAPNGPAMLIADISGKIGEGYMATSSTHINDYTKALYCCSLTVVKDNHLGTISVENPDTTSGIAKIYLDTIGYEYVYMEVPDTSTPINGYIRPY